MAEGSGCMVPMEVLALEGEITPTFLPPTISV
jgi:hypothetical protein